MHPALADRIVKSVRLRVSQGDCPIEKQFPAETLENAILELADRPTRTLRTLADALRNFAPDLAATLIGRWMQVAKDQELRLDAFLLTLREQSEGKPESVDVSRLSFGFGPEDKPSQEKVLVQLETARAHLMNNRALSADLAIGRAIALLHAASEASAPIKGMR